MIQMHRHRHGGPLRRRQHQGAHQRQGRMGEAHLRDLQNNGRAQFFRRVYHAADALHIGHAEGAHGPAAVLGVFQQGTHIHKGQENHRPLPVR